MVEADPSMPPPLPVSGEASLSTSDIPEHLCPVCWKLFAPDATVRTEGREFCPACMSPIPAEGWPLLPYRFRSRFAFKRQLGRGGMGAVFLAWDEQTRSWVAVKVVQQVGNLLQQQEKVETFSREAAAAGFLGQYPTFVRVVGHETSSPPFLAMEYVNWPTLASLLAAGPLAAVQLCRLAQPLLKSVAQMHDFNLVHCDLKPHNVFVRRRADGQGYEVKIADLGIWQRAQRAEVVTSTPPGPLAGTINYMSPEQMAGLPLGLSSDLHAVGSILWELATGRVPFPATGDSVQARLLSRTELVRQPLRPPAGLDGRLVAILERALQFNADHRWETARVMRQALHDLEQNLLVEQQQSLSRITAALRTLHDELEGLVRRLTVEEQLRTEAEGLLRQVQALGQVPAEQDPARLEAAGRKLGEELVRLRGQLRDQGLLTDPADGTRPLRQPRSAHPGRLVLVAVAAALLGGLLAAGVLRAVPRDAPPAPAELLLPLCPTPNVREVQVRLNGVPICERVPCLVRIPAAATGPLSLTFEGLAIEPQTVVLPSVEELTRLGALTPRLELKELP